MPVAIWEAALGAVGVAASGGAGAFFGRKSRSEREASSAVLLTKAYSALVDDQREDINDARSHIRRQDDELAKLREEMRALREGRDEELNALRVELSAVRTELAAVRAENQQLRTRVGQIDRRDLAA